MDPIDLEIRKRLDKLREPARQAPSEDELRDRLRVLKDLPETTNSSLTNKYVLLPKPLSEVQQVDNLMKQYTEEITLRSEYSNSSSVDEIEKRLQKLKSDDNPISQSKLAQVQPRESDTKILLKKILAEASLEKKTESQFPHLHSQLNRPCRTPEVEEKMDYSDSEEEFCTICDKYTKWICMECNKRGFCTRCFNEYHEDIGERHQKKSFMRQRRRSTDSDGSSD